MEAVKGVDDVPAPVLLIIDGTEGQEQPLIIERVQQIDGVPPVAASRVAAAMVNNTRMKKRQQLFLYCWLLLVASVIIVTNHVHVLPGGSNTAASSLCSCAPSASSFAP